MGDECPGVPGEDTENTAGLTSPEEIRNYYRILGQEPPEPIHCPGCNDTKPKPPKSRFDLTVHISAETWDEVVRDIKEIADHIKRHGVKCDMAHGGPTHGYSVQIEEDPEMTHDKYHELLQKYLNAIHEKETPPA